MDNYEILVPHGCRNVTLHKIQKGQLGIFEAIYNDASIQTIIQTIHPKERLNGCQQTRDIKYEKKTGIVKVIKKSTTLEEVKKCSKPNRLNKIKPELIPGFFIE